MEPLRVLHGSTTVICTAIILVSMHFIAFTRRGDMESLKERNSLLNAVIADIKISSGGDTPPKSVIVTLTRGDTTDLQRLIDSRRSLRQCAWYRSYDTMVFHEGDISPVEQAWVRRESNDMEMKFCDVSDVIQRRKAEGLFPHTKGVMKYGCSATPRSESFSLGYKAMCAFWFIDFADMPCIKDYNVAFRIDDDVMVEKCLYDPTPRPPALMAASAYTGDFADLTLGMATFFKDLAKSDGRNWSVDVPSVPFDHYFDMSHILPPSPFTNVVWMNLTWVRSEEVRKVQKAVDETGCIYSNRWGDLPLWGCTMQLLQAPHDILPFNYIHGSQPKRVSYIDGKITDP